MPVPILNILGKKSYETQVALLIALLATLRLIIALGIDLTRPQLNAAEIITDTALFLLFGSLLVLGLRKANFSSVNPIFGFLIIVLLGINFLQFGGIAGAARFNYYCGIFVVILLYSGRWLSALLIVQFIFLLIITFASVFEWGWAKNFFLDLGPDPTDFIFALLTLGLLSFYLKAITLNEVEKFERFSAELNKKVGYARRLNHSLVKQGEDLKRAQVHLEQEIKKRTEALERQKAAIESYIHINTSVLQAPIEELHHSLENISKPDMLQSMLLVSKSELNDVFKSIKATLEAREELNRNKLRPS